MSSEHVGQLVEADIVYRNSGMVHGSIVIVNSKGEKSFRLVRRYYAMNATMEQVALYMPNLEVMVEIYSDTKAF